MSFKLFSAARHRNCFHWSSIQVFPKSGDHLPKRALFFLQCAPAPILGHSGRRGRVNGQVCSSTAGWGAQCTQGVCSSTRWYAVCQCSSTPLSFVSAEHLVARYFSISSLFSVHTFHTVLDQANYLWYLEISVWVSWSSRISFNLVFSLIGTNKPTNKNNIFQTKPFLQAREISNKGLCWIILQVFFFLFLTRSWSSNAKARISALIENWIKIDY